MSEARHEQGIVSEVWAQEGYGYLRTRAGERVFFRRRNVRDNEFHELFVGTEVAFVRELEESGWIGEDVYVVRQDARLLPLS